jgi:tRNA pseudouridine55 synthase
MPKSFPSSLPISGLFGVAKPSGPTSMSIINDVKSLISQSRLFVDAEKLETQRSKNASKGSKRHGRPRDVVKIGQGGTLDPLADGVLGESVHCTWENQRAE